MKQQLSRKEQQLWEEWIELRSQINTYTEPIREETAQQKRERIARLIKPGNEEEFCKYYFPHYIDSEFGWFHRQGFEDIREANTFNVWEWAREHAKSVFADVFIPILKYARGELTGFILGSENETKAKALLKDSEAEFRDNRRLIEDYGEIKVIGSWLNTHFSLSNGIGFWSFGLGQNPAGVRSAEKRPNVGVIDDADNKKKYKNQQRVKEDVDWVLGEFLGCLSIKEKTFIYANNRVSKNGLTAHIVGDVDQGDPKREGINHIKVFATEDPETHQMLMPQDGGVPAWPRYSLEHIMQRIAEMGYRNAMRQFYHTHIEDGNIFKPEHIIWTDPLPLDKYDNLVTYVDPSFKDTKTSDFKAIVLIGRTGKYYDILWTWVRQDSRSNMVKAHYDIHEYIQEGYVPETYETDQYAFRQVLCRHYIEANMLQDLLVDDYDMEGEVRDYQLRIRKDKRKKPDKFGRIEDLEPLAARGLIRWNAALRKHPDMQTLKDQFLAFPNGKDDGPDAVEGAIFKLNKRSKAKKINPRMGKYSHSTNRKA